MRTIVSSFLGFSMRFMKACDITDIFNVIFLAFSEFNNFY